MFTRFPIDFHSPPPSPPPPAPPPSDPSLHRYDGAIGAVVNPERGFRMALYEFPKLNVLEGVGIDDSPLLHGQNVTGASDARNERSLARSWPHVASAHARHS